MLENDIFIQKRRKITPSKIKQKLNWDKNRNYENVLVITSNLSAKLTLVQSYSHYSRLDRVDRPKIFDCDSVKCPWWLFAYIKLTRWDFGPEKCLKEFILTWWTCFENAILVQKIFENRKFELLKSGQKSHFDTWSRPKVTFRKELRPFLRNWWSRVKMWFRFTF